MEVYERIKERRKDLGLSADDVAAALGVSRATVYRYESAEIEKLPTQIIAPLSRVLRCSPAWLMGWEETPPIADDNPNIVSVSPAAVSFLSSITVLEKQIIERFRALPDGERNMLLRSLGLEEKGDDADELFIRSAG